MTLDTAKFLDLLQQESQVAEKIYQLLLEEEQVLSQPTPQAIEKLNTPKLELINQLQALATERLEWMTSQQLEHSSTCLEHPDLKDHAGIQSAWKNLSEIYINNQELSVRLSDTVLAMRYRTEQKIKILQGGQDGQHLYDAQGKAKDIQPGVTYTQA